LVLTFGANPSAAFGVNFLLGTADSVSGVGDSLADGVSFGVFLLGEAAADALEPYSSSSSSPNDNLTLAADFCLFAGGCGVDALYFGC
jgi:hypothetical protein